MVRKKINLSLKHAQLIVSTVKKDVYTNIYLGEWNDINGKLRFKFSLQQKIGP